MQMDETGGPSTHHVQFSLLPEHSPAHQGDCLQTPLLGLNDKDNVLSAGIMHGRIDNAELCLSEVMLTSDCCKMQKLGWQVRHFPQASHVLETGLGLGPEI